MMNEQCAPTQRCKPIWATVLVPLALVALDLAREAVARRESSHRCG